MFVGVLRLAFHLPGARSLKEKRHVVRSFIERTRARFGVSIAEVSDQDLHQRAGVGVAVISSSAAICDEVLANVASSAGTLRDAVLLDRATEVMPMGAMRSALETTERAPDDDDEE